jgi:hypothetical protein
LQLSSLSERVRPVYLLQQMRSQHLNNNEELKEGVKTWLSLQATDFFEASTQKLIPLYDCRSSGDDCIEK